MGAFPHFCGLMSVVGTLRLAVETWCCSKSAAIWGTLGTRPTKRARHSGLAMSTDRDRSEVTHRWSSRAIDPLLAWVRQVCALAIALGKDHPICFGALTTFSHAVEKSTVFAGRVT